MVDRCSCIDGYYDVGGSTPLCEKCDNICETCVGLDNNCETCYSLTRQTPRCDCKLGYRNIGTVECEECEKRCLRCGTSPSDCTECRGDRVQFPDCICRIGSIELKEENCTGTILKYIQACAHKCDSCRGTVDSCVLCRGDRS
jgi:hypothetical protein